jgi:tripartite-type tricarboxylate transporter receptor subunit TctC
MNKHIAALQRCSFSTVIALTIVVAAMPGFAQTQNNFPSKPIRLVVPFSTGSGVDINARLVAAKLNESWGQPVVIENRTGGGGRLGAAMVAKAQPDGHTLLWTSAAFTISAALYSDLPYDPLKDFAGITRIGIGTGVLVVSPTLGVKSVQNFIAYAQARPGKILMGSSGAGSSTHMSGERFRLGAGIQSVHVGFKGVPEFLIEIMAGRIHFAIGGLATALPPIRDGKVLALAVTTPERSTLLPDVPALPEVLPGWTREGASALLAPAGTPRPILKKISKEVGRILSLPEIKERMLAMGFVSDPCTPEEHERFLRAQIETFSGIVRLAGLRAP